MISKPKYSIPEIERRWLVNPQAAQDLNAPPCRTIEDHYLTGSRLRLRRIDDPEAGLVFKLSKKYGKHTAVSEAITNLYLADLPADARILCVGVGTGAELAYLARTFPRWRFTALDPSGAMLNVCRQRASNPKGWSDRVRRMPETWRYFRPNALHPSLNQLALSHPLSSFRPV